MLKELINFIGDILTCPKPEPDVLGKNPQKEKKIKIVTNKK